MTPFIKISKKKDYFEHPKQFSNQKEKVDILRRGKQKHTPPFFLLSLKKAKKIDTLLQCEHIVKLESKKSKQFAEHLFLFLSKNCQKFST